MMGVSGILLTLTTFVLITNWSHAYFISPEDVDIQDVQNYDYVPTDLLLQGFQNRHQYRRVRSACTGRGGGCDHDFSACCTSLTCRCNLWGAQCRCQTTGILKK